jgi:putative membrane protein
MPRRILRSTTTTALCAAALVAACSSGDKTADSARKADSATASAAGAATAGATPAAAPAPAALTDANIVALLDAANMADSSAGSVAATKGTSADVRSFAKEMMRDHHQLRKAGQDLAKKLNVTPEAPAGDNSAAAASAWNDSLKATPKGAAWDKAYIDHEVTYHEAVLQTAQAGLGAAQNAELKALITKAAPNIEAHLKHAQSLQSKMGSSAGGAMSGGAMKDGAMKGMKKTP